MSKPITSVEVITAASTDYDSVESVKIINWQSGSDRVWLQNHMHWAMMNGVPVGLRPRAATAPGQSASRQRT